MKSRYVMEEHEEQPIDFRIAQCKARPELLGYYFPNTEGYIKTTSEMDTRDWKLHFSKKNDTIKK